MSRTDLYTLTDEHHAQLGPWAARWIANALRTEAQTDDDRDVMRSAMHGLYGAAKLSAPPREIFVASPLSGAIAAVTASCVWWLRRNPGQHVALFGRVMSRTEVDRAAQAAVRIAVEHGIAQLRGEPVPPLIISRHVDATDETGALASVSWPPAAREYLEPTGDPCAMELRMPMSTVKEFEKLEKLIEGREKDFNYARDERVHALNEHKTMLPDWLSQELHRRKKPGTGRVRWYEPIQKWRSKKLLAALVLHWEQNRFPGDAEMYWAVESWRHHDKHLWRWEEGLRQKLLDRRNNAYANIGAALARYFETFICENFNLKRVCLRPKVETVEDKKNRRYRFMAAIGGLRSILQNAFFSRQGRVFLPPPANTSRTCADCGFVNTFVVKTAQEQTCVGCGKVFDRDDNAARNLLKLWREGCGKYKKEGVTRKEEKNNEDHKVSANVWAARREKGRQKRAAREAARKALGIETEEVRF